jgi:hypothetical protein
MKSVLKELIKKFAAISGIWMLWDVYDRNRMLKVREKRGERPIAEFNLHSKKTSDQIFILGSGYSINEITPAQWTHIETHDSFGFNTWCFHPHVPTYYGLETSLYTDFTHIIVNQFNRRKEAYSKVPLFIQYQHFIKSGFSYQEHLKLAKDQVYYFVPYTPHTTNTYLLRQAIRKSLEERKNDLTEVIHYAGSLSYVIMMCYRMGYKKITLLGIDMNDPRYWYMKEGVSKEAKEIADYLEAHAAKTGRSKRGGKHATVDKKWTSKYGSLPMDTYIYILREEMLKKGVELYVGNRESRLYPTLPLYKF